MNKKKKKRRMGGGGGTKDEKSNDKRSLRRKHKPREALDDKKTPNGHAKRSRVGGGEGEQIEENANGSQKFSHKALQGGGKEFTSPKKMKENEKKEKGRAPRGKEGDQDFDAIVTRNEIVDRTGQ